MIYFNIYIKINNLNMLDFLDIIQTNYINNDTIININFGKLLFEQCFNKHISNYIIIKNIINYIKNNNTFINIEKQKYNNYSYDNKYLTIFNNNINFAFQKKYINSHFFNINEKLDIFIYIYDHISIHNDNFESQFEYNNINDVFKTSFVFDHNIKLNILKFNNTEYEINITFTDFEHIDFIKNLINEIIPFFNIN
jgi:hypothetical protein